ncbi:MAG: nucleoside phosphorylase [Candidatus Hadarchaeum sp.]|uniref:nucleoside phosphorylase n=1 Tax=Candidatus Hadarchaeum sp. TaxID=2883567 RepID=UPI00317462C1
MASKKSWYLKISSQDCAPNVILVGDPARLTLFAQAMERAQEMANEREFKTITGTYKNVPISVISVGIGAPAALIALEELWELGANVVVRAGTGMSWGIPLGNFILVQAAARFEGISKDYLPLNFPAVPNMDLFQSFYEMLRRENAPLSCGVILTSDNFYTDLFPHHIEGKQPSRPSNTLLQQYAPFGIISADMETAALYIAAQYLGIKCLSLLVATVDGVYKQALDNEERIQKERELARLTLEGIYHHVLREG